MVTHSEALIHWGAVWNGERPFPFNQTIQNARTSSDVILPSIVTLWKYFEHLKNRDTKSYPFARDAYLMVYQFTPTDRISLSHKLLLEYFSQTLKYTPINTKTGKPLKSSHTYDNKQKGSGVGLGLS